MFHDPARFTFVRQLEEHWEQVYREYAGIRTLLIDWVERDLYGAGWKVFGLFDFPQGQPIAENTARCPFTAELIQRHIPNHGAVGFSVLEPGTRIQPHVGYQGSFLRCHLGLSVPDGDCRLAVGGDTRAWQAGKALVFDDRVEHAAWNLTPIERVVLLVDFVPHEAAAPAGAG